MIEINKVMLRPTFSGGKSVFGTDRAQIPQADMGADTVNVMKLAYQIYLESDSWKEKRDTILKRRGRKCFACRTTEGMITLHHVTYARVGNELPKDLVILCWECHKKVHDLGGGWKGIRRLKHPAKWAEEKRKRKEKKKQRQQKKSFVNRMLSGPVKIYSPEEIQTFQGV